MGSSGLDRALGGRLRTATAQPGASLVMLHRTHIPSALSMQVGPRRRTGSMWSTARMAAAQNGVRQVWSRTTTRRRNTPRNNRWVDVVGVSAITGTVRARRSPSGCRRASIPTTVAASPSAKTRRTVTSEPAATVRRTSPAAKPLGSQPAPTTLAGLARTRTGWRRPGRAGADELGRAGADDLGRAGADESGRSGADDLGRAGADELGRAGADDLGRPETGSTEGRGLDMGGGLSHSVDRRGLASRGARDGGVVTGAGGGHAVVLGVSSSTAVGRRCGQSEVRHDELDLDRDRLPDRAAGEPRDDDVGHRSVTVSVGHCATGMPRRLRSHRSSRRACSPCRAHRRRRRWRGPQSRTRRPDRPARTRCVCCSHRIDLAPPGWPWSRLPRHGRRRLPRPSVPAASGRPFRRLPCAGSPGATGSPARPDVWQPRRRHGKPLVVRPRRATAHQAR